MTGPPALQAERTALAWERTALAVLASGVLLVLRHLGAPGSGALALGVLGLVLALLVAVLGARRSRRVLADPGAPARTAVLVAGASVVLFGSAVLVAVVTGALP
ncbi:DUF202 domain-containing protein [Pseudonocardia sp. KRD-184]|uniref:DUF202 domain-containing protein n=1 Tax=Pseudonocardia oceani TaxID=2792013 RepID=A0ABS6UGS7_9PSEU|nr:DUF202 domain-containing protein [Pseudonocardia oceani]MBW0091606.1 DUF202 domain-containing protein [Pseudonocardia oceani]MBW0099594.1 DUF202 domain-containing protein [Pseudonocardia oceani]MBW0112233.1 DUF202 domain-containing protein [Pseudonocardia oceani]MBW0124313.1 DUF202 domain-containing protein [Pseudonocardia oceani]MBW0131433.1 DUF202 domain-containing protein [Pseudonocardia oceani]